MNSSMPSHEESSYYTHFSEIYRNIEADLSELSHYKSLPSDIKKTAGNKKASKSVDKWQGETKASTWHKTRLPIAQTMLHLREQLNKLVEEYKTIKIDLSKINKKEQAESFIYFLRQNKTNLESLTEKISNLKQEVFSEAVFELKKNTLDLDQALKQMEQWIETPKTEKISLVMQTQEPIAESVRQLIKVPWNEQKKFFKKNIEDRGLAKKTFATEIQTLKIKEKIRINHLIKTAEIVMNQKLKNLEKAKTDIAIAYQEEGSNHSLELQENLNLKLEEFETFIGMFKDPIVMANLRLLEEHYKVFFPDFMDHLNHFSKEIHYKTEKMENQSDSGKKQR